jgi:hypothetical protein
MLTNLDNIVRYAVSGSSYAITYPYWSVEEIKAYITLSDGTVSGLTYGTDFTVTAPNGVNGTLTKVSAWTDAEKLTIVREVELTQEIDLINGEKIDGEQLETGLDLKTAGLQQLNEKFTRSVMTSIDETGDNMVIPNSTARKGTGDGTLLGFDGTGGNIVLRDLKQFDADVANTAANATAAANSATLASKWAENPVDTPVEPGNYSAKHWASKASTSAGAASVSAYNADQSAEDSEAWAVGKRSGSDVPATDPAYHNNSKYYLDLVKQTISGALRYQGTWTTTSQTDYSAIPLPRLKGDMYYCQGTATTIDGVTYTQGDYIIFNVDVPSGTITTSAIDKIDNTETVTPDNTCTLENKTIAFGDNTMTDVASTNTSQTLTNKTIDADNNTLKNVVTSKNISNCITEIPQDINLTLSSGTLTLKAGSKVYVPNGANNFDTYTLTTDKTLTLSDNTKQMICVNASNGNLFERRLSNCVSGAGATTIWGFAYNTTTNQIRAFNAGGSDLGSNYSFPIAIVTVSGGAISSIDQIFNGMGYIGSILFALPGLGVIVPNGRNTDGTLKNINIKLTQVRTQDNPSAGVRYLAVDYSGALTSQGANSWRYDENLNFWVSGTTTLAIGSIAIYDAGNDNNITTFRPKTAFHAVDYNYWQRHIGTGIEQIISVFSSGVNSGNISYVVRSGICFVDIRDLKMTATGNSQSVCTLPKHRYANTMSGMIGINAEGTAINGTFYVNTSGGLYFNCKNTTNTYCLFSYPVADDWVES